jgi:hypothetical protein
MYACVEIDPKRRLLADRTGRGSRDLVYLSQSIRSKFMNLGPSGCFGLTESKPDSSRPWLEEIWTIEKPPFPRWSKSQATSLTVCGQSFALPPFRFRFRSNFRKMQVLKSRVFNGLRKLQFGLLQFLVLTYGLEPSFGSYSSCPTIA